MNIAFFGSSLVSAYWNGAATYYRGIIKALHRLGHKTIFFEPDAFERQRHRDLPDPDWAKVVVYPAAVQAALHCVERARNADVVVKASGVGVFDELLEAAVADIRTPNRLVVFWDVDAPATLARLAGNDNDPLRALLPSFDLVLTYGGGQAVVDAYLALGAQACTPIYNALDPDEHFRAKADPRFRADLAFLGNRLPDREARVDEFLVGPAHRLPDKKFVLGGSGWHDKPLAPNIDYVGHVYTRDHNAFNSTPTAVLNISRASMAETGFSPATRVFEAAGAGACLISDAWQGIEDFLEPDSEVLLVTDGDQVVETLMALTPVKAHEIGERARSRVLAEHCYSHRARVVEEVLMGAPSRARP